MIIRKNYVYITFVTLVAKIEKEKYFLRVWIVCLQNTVSRLRIFYLLNLINMGCCHEKQGRNDNIPSQTQQTSVEDQAKFFGQLAEVQLISMSHLLHKNIGVILFASSRNQEGCGSGTLISPNVVLTCAHNIFDFKNQSLNQNFQFFPGQYGQFKEPFEVKDTFFPEAFKTNKGPQNDYGLLFLQKKVEQAEFVPLETEPMEMEGKECQLAIYGYPGNRYQKHASGKLNKGSSQWGATKSQVINNMSNTQIIHKISTNSGQSGSPIIWVKDDNSCTIVGIHKGCNRNRGCNIGTLLNPELIETLEKEIDKRSAAMFGVTNSLRNSKERKIIFRQAEQDFKVNNFQESTKGYFQLVNRYPHYPVAHFNLAHAYMKRNQVQAAINHYEKAVNLQPKNELFLNNLGTSLLKVGRYSESVVILKRALQIQPKYCQALVNLASAYNKLTQYQKAARQLEKALKIKPDYLTARQNLDIVNAKLARLDNKNP